MKSALELYEQALGTHEPAQVRFVDGSLARLSVPQYLASADGDDLELLESVAGPVLDVGCGPGRHLHALAARGVFALGVDLSPAAVAVARQGGGRALVVDVFGEVPNAGTWSTALLLDGNIGIGGSPDRLLGRLKRLLIPGGVVLAELDAPELASPVALARIETGEENSDWFPWARVSVADISAVAADAAMALERTWQCGERWFARLRSLSAG